MMALEMMTENMDGYLYILLDGNIHASARVDGGVDDAFVVAAKRLAHTHATSYIITQGDLIQLDQDRSGTRLAQVIVHDGYRRDDANELTAGQLIATVAIEKAEDAFEIAIAEIRRLAADAQPCNDDAVQALQNAYGNARKAADRAGTAQPPVQIDVQKEIEDVLAQSAWKLNGGAISSRVSGVTIGALTSAFDWEGKRARSFKYSMTGQSPWLEALVFVQETGAKWAIADIDRSWLHERKRQFGLNDSEIRAIHQALEVLACRVKAEH